MNHLTTIESNGTTSERITVYCRKCAASQLVPDTSIKSTHRSAEGLIGYAQCNAGHWVVHQFAKAPTHAEAISVGS